MSIFDTIYKPLRIQEKHLSASALRRLKIAVITAMPFIPLIAGVDYLSLSSHPFWKVIATTLTIASLVALLYIAVNPITNTLSRTNKNLDEWEVGHKLAAESFSLRIGIWSIMVVWIGFAFSGLKFSMSAHNVANLFFSFMVTLILTSTAHIAWTIRPITMEDGLPVREDKAVVTARKQKVEAAIILTVASLILLAGFVGAIALGWMSAHNAAGH